MKLPIELRAARLSFSHQWPYLTTALWSMHPVAVSEEEVEGEDWPMAVDKYWRLYYRPDIISDYTPEQIAAVLCHEVNHLLRGHAERAEALDAQSLPWNYAADAEINDNLHAEGADLPGNYVTPYSIGQPEGELAETYYHNMDKTEDDHCKHNCGSAAHGKDECWELGEPDNATQPGIDAFNAKVIRRQTAVATIKHNLSKGNVPQELVRWADDTVSPKVRWTRELSAALRNSIANQAGLVDYTYRRPSRRQSAFPNVIQPALRAPTPNLAVVIDTSGSMSEDMLGQALAETKSVLQRSGLPYVPVLPCDTQVSAVQKVFHPRQIQLDGGGGTDMGQGMAAAARLKPKPDVVIIMTDMATDWPKEPPPYKLICVAFEDSDSYPPPAYAKVITVEV